MGLGTGQVPGKLGTQVSLHLGPQDVQRSLGRRGREAAGPEDRHLQGRAGLSREWDPGASPAQRARPGLEWPGVGGRRDLRTPQPTPQARREPTHTSPPGHWGVREALRAPGPGQALAGLVLAVFGGAGRRQQAGVRSRVVRLKYSTPPEERCGPLARPAGRSEREAKCKALKAPRANCFSLRTYQPEGAGSCLISEAKQGRAWLGSWMGDHLGIPGARGFLPTRRGPLAPAARPDSWIPPAAPAGAPTPAADLGCLRAAREPLRIRIRLPGHPTTGSPVSIWGSFGLPQAIPGLTPTPAIAPAPASPTASQAIARACTDVPKRGIYLVHLYCGWIYAWESDC